MERFDGRGGVKGVHAMARSLEWLWATHPSLTEIADRFMRASGRDTWRPIGDLAALRLASWPFGLTEQLPRRG